MSDPMMITLMLPSHSVEKLEELQAHYLVPPDMQCQRLLIDRIDEVHELVILEPARKKVSQ